MTRRKRTIVGLLLGVVLRTPVALAAPAVVADVQVRPVAGGEFVLRLQSTASQAFDVLPAPRGQFALRLYQARLGALPRMVETPFGRAVLAEERAGNVVLHLTLTDPAVRLRAVQGANPNVVEIRASR